LISLKRRTARPQRQHWHLREPKRIDHSRNVYSIPSNSDIV
jgi:hypothetical protein